MALVVLSLRPGRVKLSVKGRQISGHRRRGDEAGGLQV